jgi:hypothetical protein
MKLKSTLFAGVLAASLAVPAFANDAPVSTPLPQFTAADTQMLFAQDTMPMQLAVLSQQEMMETEGAVLPLYAVGVFAAHTGRFIATQYVSRTIAANAARSGCNVMCYGTAQQARSLATQAYGRGNVMRHGPSHHTKHVDFSHFQSRSGSPSGHIFYGQRFPR